MNTEILLDRFKKLLSMEEKAKAGYEHYIGKLSDDYIRNTLIQIKDDEKQHVNIVKKIINYLSRG